MNENKIEELTTDEGIEIADEQLDAIAGGGFTALADHDDEDAVVKQPIPKHDVTDGRASRGRVIF